jgi:predicted nucleic acid-binding protein
MTRFVIADAGPLVAFLDRSEPLHDWAEALLAQPSLVLLTCEAVLTEAFFLLSKVPGGVSSLLKLIETAPIFVEPLFESNKRNIVKLMLKYADVPMSFADACLVQLSELYPDAPILTLDSDFLIYRRNKKEPLTLILPKTQVR